MWVDAYLTKYALSDGIRRVLVKSVRSDRYQVHGLHSMYDAQHIHFNVQAANDKAREMARKKLASLEKQTAKVRLMAQTPKWSKK